MITKPLGLLASGDWEITEARIPALTIALEALHKQYRSADYDGFVFAGDLLREFTDVTVAFARKWIERFQPAILLLGNHDWTPEYNKTSAIFQDQPGGPIIISEPQILNYKGRELAFLPAPNRDRLGAALEAQGPRERDKAISEVLDYLLLELEQKAADPARTPLFFHATVAATTFGGSKLGDGLTWTIDAGRLAAWAAAIGGHIHNPEALVADITSADGRPVPILYTGTITHDTHGQKAQRFRALRINIGQEEDPDNPGNVSIFNVPLPSGVVPIEVTLAPEGLTGEDGELYPGPRGASLAQFITGYLADRAGVRIAQDLVDLKIRATMPRADLDLLPTEEALQEALQECFRGGDGSLVKLQIKREETGAHKVRSTIGAPGRSASSLPLGELFDAWLKASGLEGHPNADLARLAIVGRQEKDWQIRGVLGIRPIRTRIRNFRQWREADISWDDFNGTTAVTGDNETGKTNLIEAALFAWYKKTPRTEGRSEGLKVELMLGETKGLVEHTWQSGDLVYMVRRAMERDLSGKVSCKTELFRIAGDEEPGIPEELVSLAGGAEADAMIAEIVGPYDYATSTYYGTASQISGLIDATPARWHELFSQTLKLGRFEELRKAAADEVKELQKALNKAQILVDEGRRQAVEKEDAAKELGDPADAEKTLKEASGAMDDEKAKVAALRAAMASKAAELAVLEDKIKNRDAMIKKMAAARDAYYELEKFPAEDPGLPPAPAEVGDVTEEEAPRILAEGGKELAELGDQRDKVSRQLAEERGLLDAREKTLADTLKQLDEKLALMTEAVTDPGISAERVNLQIKDLDLGQRRLEGALRSDGAIHKLLEANAAQLQKAIEGRERDLAELNEALHKAPAMPCVSCNDLPNLTDICPAFQSYSRARDIQEATEKRAEELAGLEKVRADQERLAGEIKAHEAEIAAVLKEIEDLGGLLGKALLWESAQQVTSEISRLDKTAADHRWEIGACKNTISRLTAERDQLDGRQQALKGTLRDLQKIVQAMRDRAQAAAIWELKSKAFHSWGERLARAADAKREAEDLFDQVEAAGHEARKIQDSMAEDRRLADSAEEWIQKLARVEADTRRRLEKIQQARAEADKLFDKVRRLEAEAEADRAQAGAWSLLVQAFHATGIRLMLIEQVLEGFQAGVNRLLSGTDMSVQVRQAREVGEGGDKKVVDEIWVTFTDKRGTFPLRLASGEQRQTLGIPLRAQLAHVGSEFWGNRPELFVQDEGFGAFDGGKLQIAIDLIRKIARLYVRFVFITHVKGMAAAADHVFLVEDSGDGTSGIRAIS